MTSLKLGLGKLAFIFAITLLASTNVYQVRADTQYDAYSTGKTYLSSYGSGCLVAQGVLSNCYRQAWSSTELFAPLTTVYVYVTQDPWWYAWSYYGCGGDYCYSFSWSDDGQHQINPVDRYIVHTDGPRTYTTHSYPYSRTACIIAWASHTTNYDAFTFYYTSAGFPGGSPDSCPQTGMG